MKLFIDKNISDQDLVLTLKKDDASYPLTKIISIGLEKDQFNGYRLSSQVSIPDGEYDIFINGIDVKSKVSITDTSSLIDEHEPIYIIGRQINPVTTTILAQDANSQQFTFYIKKKYDGISFLDEDKRVYIDYIPVDKNDLNIEMEDGEVKTVEFLSDPISEIIYNNVIPPDGQEGEWVVLKWNLPYPVTKTAGRVTFALSVVDPTNNRYYTWQTLPSSFEISANIGYRDGINLSPKEESIFADLSERVASIEDSLGNQTDEDAENDVEVIFEGGNASTVV